MGERRITMVFKWLTCRKKCYIYVYDPPYPNEDDDTNYELVNTGGRHDLGTFSQGWKS